MEINQPNQDNEKQHNQTNQSFYYQFNNDPSTNPINKPTIMKCSTLMGMNQPNQSMKAPNQSIYYQFNTDSINQSNK